MDIDAVDDALPPGGSAFFFKFIVILVPWAKEKSMEGASESKVLDARWVNETNSAWKSDATCFSWKPNPIKAI